MLNAAFDGGALEGTGDLKHHLPDGLGGLAVEVWPTVSENELSDVTSTARGGLTKAKQRVTATMTQESAGGQRQRVF